MPQLLHRPGRLYFWNSRQFSFSVLERAGPPLPQIPCWSGEPCPGWCNQFGHWRAPTRCANIVSGGAAGGRRKNQTRNIERSRFPGRCNNSGINSTGHLNHVLCLLLAPASPSAPLWFVLKASVFSSALLPLRPSMVRTHTPHTVPISCCSFWCVRVSACSSAPAGWLGRACVCLVRAKAVGRDKSTTARRIFKKEAVLTPGPKQLLKKKDVDRLVAKTKQAVAKADTETPCQRGQGGRGGGGGAGRAEASPAEASPAQRARQPTRRVWGTSRLGVSPTQYSTA